MGETPRPLVVVTRPRDEARALAARLETLGYDALIEPMLVIVPLDVPLPPLDGFAAIVFTSANGARAFAGLTAAHDRPTFAVGSATESTLRAAGFGDVRPGPSDAAGLARVIASQMAPGARLLHVSGTVVARELGPLLDADGISVDRLTLYDAVPVTRLSDPLVAALYACTVRFVLFFSARTAAVFATLVVELGLTEACRPIAALCLSPAVAARASALPWARIAAASEPTEGALLALLPPSGS